MSNWAQTNWPICKPLIGHPQSLGPRRCLNIFFSPILTPNFCGRRLAYCHEEEKCTKKQKTKKKTNGKEIRIERDLS